MSYFTIIQKNKDSRINTMLYALSQAHLDIQSLPKSIVELGSTKLTVSESIKANKALLSQLEGNEALLEFTDLSALEASISSLETLDSEIESRITELKSDSNKVQKVPKILMDRLHKLGEPIKNCTSQISTSQYHGYNAFSKDGLLDLASFDKVINKLKETHLKDTSVEIYKNPEISEPESGLVEINRYTNLYSVFFAEQDIESVSLFLDSLKDELVLGKEESFYQSIMSSRDPQTHYLIPECNFSGEDLSEYVRAMAKKEANNDVCYAFTGRNQSDFLKTMMDDGVSFSDISLKGGVSTYEVMMPHIECQDEDYVSWSDSPFSDSLGTNKSKDEYSNAALYTMSKFIEDNPELSASGKSLLNNLSNSGNSPKSGNITPSY